MTTSLRNRMRAAAIAGTVALAGLVALPATGAAASTDATTAQAAQTPIQKAGRLQVCGTQLCDKNGKPVQLRGMSTHGLQWFENCVTDASLDALATDWRSDVIRLSTYVDEDGYETDPAYFTKLADTLIQKAYDRGMYVIVDWHQLDPGDPWDHVEGAKKFLSTLAAKHGDKGTVLWEIANEPNDYKGDTQYRDVDWNHIKSYADAVIPSIRAKDPDGIVLVGTPDWSSLGQSGHGAAETLRAMLKNPVKAPNVMYTFHFYAHSHRSAYLKALDKASDVLPIFVTEWGTENSSGSGTVNLPEAKKFLDLMAKKNISWTKWNFSDDHRTGAAFVKGTCAKGGPYSGASLKESGKFAREQIRAGAL